MSCDNDYLAHCLHQNVFEDCTCQWKKKIRVSLSAIYSVCSPRRVSSPSVLMISASPLRRPHCRVVVTQQVAGASGPNGGPKARDKIHPTRISNQQTLQFHHSKNGDWVHGFFLGDFLADGTFGGPY